MRKLFFLFVILCLPFLSYSKPMVLPRQVKVEYWLEPNNAKRNSSFPFISGDSFRAISDHIFDEARVSFDSDDVKPGDIIFVNPDYIHIFFTQVHPHISEPYILITHNALFSPPGKYLKELESDKILGWFTKNPGIENHPKLHGVPLGLANNYWPHGNTQIVRQIMEENIEKDKLLHLNVKVCTHESRSGVVSLFKDKPYCYATSRKPYKDYMHDLARSKFVLSPRGAGMDCHRTWEALLVGSIPIVPSTKINKLYEKLPVLVIDDWSIVNEEFLQNKWKEMHQIGYDYERMFVTYWLDKIKAYQKQAREKLKKG